MGFLFGPALSDQMHSFSLVIIPQLQRHGPTSIRQPMNIFLSAKPLLGSVKVQFRHLGVFSSVSLARINRAATVHLSDHLCQFS